MLRCGRISYTNDLPIYSAFDAGAVTFPGSLRADVPARLNALLLGGELDLGPISAYEWAKHAGELVLLPDLCIGARAEVVSVVLVSATPPGLLADVPVYLTRESATGRNLVRVILERRYGVAPAYLEEAHPLERARSGAAVLLIGDAAIDAVETFPAEHVYDLGRLWHEWTGADSVFAVWTARRDVYEREPYGTRACMRAFADAYAWSRAHMNQVVASAERTIPRPSGFYESYYAKLNYTFDAAAQSGLAAFCRELNAIGAIDAVPSTVPEVIDAVAR
jgi:chorismate dehydratase